MPDLYILTGSNGAGKSTTGKFYLPAHLKETYSIFDGDKLFAKKRKETYKIITPSLKEAERIAGKWLHEEFERQVLNAINNKDHFVYEGHFPEEDNWITPLRFKKAGYTVHMIFLGLSDTSTSELRVLKRAKMGGHNVAPYEIERNFYGNLYQLNRRYHEIDELQIIDTSENIPRVVAIFRNGEIDDTSPVKEIPDWFETGLPDLFHKIYIYKNASRFKPE
jgi:predicted ABC-type ATPase